MSRLQCLGKSSQVSQKQVTPAHRQTPNSEEAVEESNFIVGHRSGKQPETEKQNLKTQCCHDMERRNVCKTEITEMSLNRRSLPAQTVSHPMKDTVPVRLEVLCAGAPTTKEPIKNRSRFGECAQSIEVTNQDLNMKDKRKPQQSDTVGTAGGRVCVPPPAEPLPPPEPEGEEDRTEEDEDDDDDDEGHRAPLELIAEFLKSVMERDFLLANKLCQMILIYEPENPEARQFLPLIQEKLLREQEEDGDNDDEDGSDSSDEDDSGDSGSDEDLAQSSGSSSSSTSSSSSEDEEEEEEGRRHKPCPPSHLPP